MVVRLLLALLLAALALPATAAMPACHGGGAKMAAMHHGTDAPAKAPPSHLCAGCVPLADWLGDRITAPILPAAPGPVVRIATFDPGMGSPPALPPPRHG